MAARMQVSDSSSDGVAQTQCEDGSGRRGGCLEEVRKMELKVDV